MKNPFEPLLRAQGFVVLDGAMATELERRGADLSSHLWSAKVLQDDPQAIVGVHVDMLRAGADVVSTASYQASREGFAQMGLAAPEADALLEKSVHLAREACSRAAGSRTLKALVAGSLGPYGAILADGSEYRGDYPKTAAELADFHRPRLDALVRGGPDLVLFETLPSLAEGEAVAQLARERPDVPLMVSFCAVSARGIAHGEPFTEAVRLFDGLENVIAVGINCAPPEVIGPLLASVKPPRPLLAASPNSGEKWDAASRRWIGRPRGDLGSWALRYVEAGARVIGGCCRTQPGDIAKIRRALGLQPV